MRLAEKTPPKTFRRQNSYIRSEKRKFRFLLKSGDSPNFNYTIFAVSTYLAVLFQDFFAFTCLYESCTHFVTSLMTSFTFQGISRC